MSRFSDRTSRQMYEATKKQSEKGGCMSLAYFTTTLEAYEKRIRADQHRKTMNICYEAIHDADLIKEPNDNATD